MKPTLLITDRNAELCDLYKKFLSEHGYEVETASDGLACLAKLRQALPAVILLDLELPWGGGNGVLAWLQEEAGATQVVVILTARADHWGGEAIRPPVLAFLPKPFTPASLLDVIASAIARGQVEGIVETCRTTAAPVRLNVR